MKNILVALLLVGSVFAGASFANAASDCCPHAACCDGAADCCN